MFRLLTRRSADSEAKLPENESVDTLSCRFSGSTKEFFEIWIVNLLLTVCTLGVFRPWAKARCQQYFYSHTWLGNHQLGYWPTPQKMMHWAGLHSALILITLVAAIYKPWLAIVPVAIALLTYPLYRHQNLVQHAHATAYRGRRLAYHGTVKDSYLRLLGWPVVTFALAFLPLGHSLRSSWEYRLEHHSYGSEPFSARLKLPQLWSLVLLTALTTVAALCLVVAAATGITTALSGPVAADAFLAGLTNGEFVLPHYLCLVGFILALVWPLGVWRACSEHLLLSGVRLEAGFAFDSEMSTAKMTGLYIQNAVVVLLTFGLAVPWAAIRLAQYRASVVTLLCYADIDQIVADRETGLFSLQQASELSDDQELLGALDSGELDLPKAA